MNLTHVALQRGIVGAGGGAFGKVLYLHDAFTGADATALNAHTIAPIRPGAAAWTNNASWKIYGNQAREDTVTQAVRTATVPLPLNCILSGIFTVDASAAGAQNMTGFVARFISTTSTWFVGVSVADGKLYIASRDTTTTTRASASYAFVAATPYLIKAIMRGNHFTAEAWAGNGSALLATCSYLLASFNGTVGVHGVVSGSKSAGQYDYVDDFKVYV